MQKEVHEVVSWRSNVTALCITHPQATDRHQSYKLTTGKLTTVYVQTE